MIRVRIVREYDLAVSDLYPDGIPSPPRAYAKDWPSDWDDERRAVFHFNETARSNPFAESSFARDFEGDCDRSSMAAQVVLGGEPS